MAKLGYEIVGARLNWIPSSINDDPIPLEELEPIEPMLTIRGGWARGRLYEEDEKLVNDPGLFRRFAQLEPTPEAVLSFASEYGLLLQEGLPIGIALTSVQNEHISHVLFDASHERPFSEQYGAFAGYYAGAAEALRFWYAEVDAMREAVGLWDTSKTGDEDARVDLGIVLNEKIERNVQTRMRYAEGRSLELAVSPDCLRDALWLQLAVAVDGRKAFRKCANPACGNWFEIGKFGSRADRKFCSEACKQAVYDEKQRQKKRQSVNHVPDGETHR